MMGMDVEYGYLRTYRYVETFCDFCGMWTGPDFIGANFIDVDRARLGPI